MDVQSKRVFQISSNPRIKDWNDRAKKSDKGNNLKERIRLYVPGNSNDEMDCRVFLSGRDFKAVFGKRHANTRFKQFPKVVKITRRIEGQQPKSIYRLYGYNSAIHEIEEYAGLSYNSLLGLCYNKDDFYSMDRVILTPSNWIMYYLFYPIFVTRISIWVGLLGLLAGFLSFIPRVLIF